MISTTARLLADQTLLRRAASMSMENPKSSATHNPVVLARLYIQAQRKTSGSPEVLSAAGRIYATMIFDVIDPKNRFQKA